MTARVQAYSESDAANDTGVSAKQAREAWNQAAQDSEYSITSPEQARQVLLSK